MQKTQLYFPLVNFMLNKHSVIVINDLQTKDAASSSILLPKILNDTDNHAAMALSHQSVGISRGSALISMLQEDESLGGLRGNRKVKHEAK